MPVNHPLVTVAFVTLLFVGVTLLSRAIIRLMMRRIDRLYPPSTPAVDAVRRGGQSFSFGPVNATMSIHVAADESHLHLTPISLLRLFGMRSMSIPWEAIEVHSAGRWFTTAKIAGVTVRGPSWCLRLAEHDPASNP